MAINFCFEIQRDLRTFKFGTNPAGEKRKAEELTKYGTAGNKKELKMEDGGG